MQSVRYITLIYLFEIVKYQTLIQIKRTKDATNFAVFKLKENFASEIIRDKKI